MLEQKVLVFENEGKPPTEEVNAKIAELIRKDWRVCTASTAVTHRPGEVYHFVVTLLVEKDTRLGA